MDLNLKAVDRPSLPSLAVVPPALEARTSLGSRYSDFWFLGGASLLAWALIVFFYAVAPNVAIQQRFAQLPVTIAFLSLVVNHPHFMSSYKFAYGRSARFIFQNWFALIFVPVAFVSASAVAFAFYDYDLTLLLGPSFEFQGHSMLGPMLMSFILLSMYLTVGWHYAKQIFGCMMTYAKYDRFPVSSALRGWLKASVFSVAYLQMIFMTRLMEAVTTGVPVDSRFPAFPVVQLGFPNWFETAGWIAVAISSVGFITVLIRHYLQTKQAPSINFMVPYIAFCVWWLPVHQMPEFMLLIPFFHSLQYLPFAWRMEHGKGHPVSTREKAISTAKLFALLTSGFLAFEYVPTLLDQWLSTDIHQGQWFFVALFAVVINVHHFFMDSVIWRNRDASVRQALFGT